MEKVTATTLGWGCIILRLGSRVTGNSAENLQDCWTFPQPIRQNRAWLDGEPSLRVTESLIRLHGFDGFPRQVKHGATFLDSSGRNAGELSCRVSIGRLVVGLPSNRSVRRSAAVHGCRKETKLGCVRDHVSTALSRAGCRSETALAKPRNVRPGPA
jgi:hypothetical protein